MILDFNKVRSDVMNIIKTITDLCERKENSVTDLANYYKGFGLWSEVVKELITDDSLVYYLDEKVFEVIYNVKDTLKRNWKTDNLDVVDDLHSKILNILDTLQFVVKRVSIDYFDSFVYEYAKRILKNPELYSFDTVKDKLANEFVYDLKNILDSTDVSNVFDINDDYNHFNRLQRDFDKFYISFLKIVDDILELVDTEDFEDVEPEDVDEVVRFLDEYRKRIDLAINLMEKVYECYYKPHFEIGLGESCGNKKQKRRKLSQMKESNTVSKFMKDTITMIDKVQEQSDSEIAKRWLSLSPNEKHEILKRLFEKQALSSSKYAIITTGEQNSDSIVISNYFNNVEIKPIPRPDKYVAKEII